MKGPSHIRPVSCERRDTPIARADSALMRSRISGGCGRPNSGATVSRSIL